MWVYIYSNENPSPVTEEYVLLSNGWSVNKYSELTRYWTQSVRNNSTNWLWYAESMDNRWVHYKTFTKEIVWFEVVQNTTNNAYDHVEFQLAPSASFSSGNMPSLVDNLNCYQECQTYWWSSTWRVLWRYAGTTYLNQNKNNATTTITWTWRKTGWVRSISCVTSNWESWNFSISGAAALYVIWFKAWRWNTWSCWYWISAKVTLQ